MADAEERPACLFLPGAVLECKGFVGSDQRLACGGMIRNGPEQREGT